MKMPAKTAKKGSEDMEYLVVLRRAKRTEGRKLGISLAEAKSRLGIR